MALGADVLVTDRKLSRSAASTLLKQLAANPNVECVEVDALMRADMTPNDPKYNGATDKQWHYFNSSVGIRAPAAWDVSTGRNTLVAVVDSGYLNHEDLAGQYLPGYDFVSVYGTPGQKGDSDDGDGRDSDPLDNSNVRHGNHVAGTIAALGNNGVGGLGVAYNTKVIPVRVLGNSGWGQTSDITDGIIWAAGGSVPGAPANPYWADAINVSIGGQGTCTSTWQNAVNKAVELGSTVVVSAGNDNTLASGQYPANCNNVVVVVASNARGNRAVYSNYGSAVDLTAPGGQLCEPVAPALTCPSTGIWHKTEGVLSTTGPGVYSYWEGTSMAAPHVAAIAALVQSASNAFIWPVELERLLKAATRPLPGTCSGGCGTGLIDATAAVNIVRAPSPYNLTATRTGTSGTNKYYRLNWSGGTAKLDIVVTNGSGVSTATYYSVGNTNAFYNMTFSGSGTATFRVCNVGTPNFAYRTINY